MSAKHSDLEVIHTAVEWLKSDHSVHLVTVVQTWGSSPRPVGSMAAVRDDGVLIGSVSGGCVEKQLSEQFLQQEPKAIKERVISHHIDDEQARRFGLSCGGKLELVFELMDSSNDLEPLLENLQKRQRVTRSVDLSTGHALIHNSAPLDKFKFDGQQLIKVFGPDWRLLIIGAGQLSRFTAEFALALDYEVIVCDPRPGFREAWSVDGTTLLDLSPDDAVLQYAIDQRSAVLALTHDPNVDDMALMEALPGRAFYVGALGSKTNYEKRKHRLSAIGLEPHEIERLHGPVGLDIGSRTSAEIAVSIVADLIRQRSIMTADADATANAGPAG